MANQVLASHRNLLHVTSSHHPSVKGMTEHWHRSLKAAIKCYAFGRWVYTLPTILLTLRSIVKEDLQSMPAELLYGERLRLPSQFFEQSFPDELQSSFL